MNMFLCTYAAIELGVIILPISVFVTIACVKRTGASASVERRRREGDLAGVTQQRQSFLRMRTLCFGLVEYAPFYLMLFHVPVNCTQR